MSNGTHHSLWASGNNLCLTIYKVGETQIAMRCAILRSGAGQSCLFEGKTVLFSYETINIGVKENLKNSHTLLGDKSEHG
jgi:hypothetical protein